MTNADHHSFGEFFAGIGLMRLGLEKAGWRVAFANDIDEDKQAMYHAHFGDTGEFLLGDVHQLDAAIIPDLALATASFPCNDLSLAGARAGLAGAQSSAFWGFIEVLKNLGDRRPALVLLENVVGFLTSRKGDDFKQALEALNALEYTVDALIVDAARFVPQSRKRLFVVGIRRRGPARFKARRPVQPSDCRPKNLVEFIARHPEIDWRVRPLPPLPDLSPKLTDILEEVPASSREWWNTKRATYLLDQMSPAHRAEAEAMIQGATVTYGTVFRRVRQGKSMAELRTNEIAGCLRTPRGGSGRQILFAAGQGKFGVRLLTPRECARLMGAGDYRIEAKMTKALFGFGDAVCVPVIEWIARNYLNPVLAEEAQQQSVAP